MKYNFDEIIDRAGTHSSRWDIMPEGAGKDVISLWIADMDFTCPEPVLQAIHKRVDRKILGYTQYDNDRLKNAVCSWFKRRHDWEIDKSSIFFSPGVVPACSFFIDALTEEGDGVIIQNPVYYPFTGRIKGNKRVVANNALVRKGSKYFMNFEDLEEKFANPKNKGMILCSPHNPVGRVWTEDELLKLLAIAKKYGKWIISDEIHCDLTRTGIDFIPLMKVAGDYKDRIITCTSVAKTFNLAGLKYSNIIIPNPEYQKIWKDITRTKTSLTDSCNPLSMEATIAAYNEGDDWLDQVREYLDGNINFVDKYLKENLPKAALIDCEGTYLIWIDLRAYCSDPKKLEHAMLHDAKVVIDEGYIFGDEGIGYERINIATPRATVAECLERMKRALLNL